MGWLDGQTAFGGSPNELILEANKPRLVRVLCDDDEMPLKYFIHRVSEDKDIGRKYHPIVCVGKNSGCMLCEVNNQPSTADLPNKDKPYPFSAKFVINVYDYETKSVKVLNNGLQLFRGLEMAIGSRGSLMGYDVTLSKTGQGKMGTEYAATPQSDTPFKITDFEKVDLQNFVAGMTMTSEQIGSVIDGSMDASGTSFNVKEIEQQTKTSIKKTEKSKSVPAGKNNDLPEVESKGPPNIVLIEHGKHKGKSVKLIAEKDPKYLEYLAFGGNKESKEVRAAAIAAHEAALGKPAEVKPAKKKPEAELTDEEKAAEPIQADKNRDIHAELKKLIQDKYAADFNSVSEAMKAASGEVRKIDDLTEAQATQVLNTLTTALLF